MLPHKPVFVKSLAVGIGLGAFVILLLAMGRWLPQETAVQAIAQVENEDADHYLPLILNQANAAATPPPAPYLVLAPQCANGPDVQFTVVGFNWPAAEGINLFWDSDQLQSSIAAEHGGSFAITWTFNDVTEDGAYVVRAVSASHTASSTFSVPCPDPGAVDLQVVGPPVLLSETPLIAYSPVDFSVQILNAGSTDVNKQFFVDLFINPGEIYTDRIPLSQSAGYSAVSSLAAGSTRTLTITISSAFGNEPLTHTLYAMVDSVHQIDEAVETNNISPALLVSDVTPVPTATPTNTPEPLEPISGLVSRMAGDLTPQFRAVVRLKMDETVIASTLTDQDGLYEFANLPPHVYTVDACVNVDGVPYYGVRTGITPPDSFANIYLLPGPCP